MQISSHKSTTETDADDYLDNYSTAFSGDTHYYTIISMVVSHSKLGGGNLLIEGCKTSNLYEWQKATKYDSSKAIAIYARSKSNGIWGEWKSIT